MLIWMLREPDNSNCYSQHNMKSSCKKDMDGLHKKQSDATDCGKWSVVIRGSEGSEGNSDCDAKS